MSSLDSNSWLALPKWQPVAVPEDDVVFRLAQLLLLFQALDRADVASADIERLGYYDFLSANPFLIAEDISATDRTKLLLAGFDGRALSYASPSQRFTSRRERLQHDLVLLLAYGLADAIVLHGVQYSLTGEGRRLASQFTAVYAQSYSVAADIVLRHVRRLSPTRLRENVHRWLSVYGSPTHPGAAELLDIVGDMPAATRTVLPTRLDHEEDTDR
ncbi:ABC-three component system middle component 2 [Amycolatopsis sp. Hca4]|uniref:ABC-three component system middle component 2 n=1 Tax=Amycolatopsis sp. Hca4 TaxID=2742131 RepID=UPI0015918A3D|nr:ABC-three component system middle component 2 [Amycolatopsis sp. Hca4]QKV74242.1 hypothetical protein HUT10_11035 [Amycolatopsis sp. Hca4]